MQVWLRNEPDKNFLVLECRGLEEFFHSQVYILISSSIFFLYNRISEEFVSIHFKLPSRLKTLQSRLLLYTKWGRKAQTENLPDLPFDLVKNQFFNFLIMFLRDKLSYTVPLSQKSADIADLHLYTDHQMQAQQVHRLLLKTQFPRHLHL